jgi:hypothetical protein
MTRTAYTGSQGRRTKKASASLVVCLSLAGCSGTEPTFRTAALTDPSPEEALGTAEAVETVDLDAIRAAGLGASLSEDTPPPPFLPDEEHYPPAPPDRSFETALRVGTPRLVYVVSVAREGDDVLVDAREEVRDREPITIVLPRGYACTAPGAVVPDRRFIIITEGEDEHGRHELYLGLGAQHAILPVDDRGFVYTPLGARDAAELARTEGRSS